jgi:DNA-directed RNA polymerase specialized sigma24 family protein
VYSEGLTYAEAGAVMGVNAKRVDHLLSRGKKQMREELKKEGVLGAYA